MLSNDIVIFRMRKCWTQQQLADAVFVTRQTILALEKERYNPSLILAFRLAKALDTNIDTLFHFSEE